MHTSSILTRLVGSTLGAIAAAACVRLGTPALASASQASEAVIVTASNLATNQLLVYSPAGPLLQALPVFTSH